MFRDWLFIGCSSWFSLATAANLLLFPNVTIFWRENAKQQWRLNNCFSFFYHFEGKTRMSFFNKTTGPNLFSKLMKNDINGLQEKYLRFSYSCLGGKQNSLHAKSRYKVGKSTVNTITTEKNCRSRREKHNFPHLSFLICLVFSLFRHKMYRLDPSEK